MAVPSRGRLRSKSPTEIPESDSTSAGTCATILATSAVTLLTPALAPFPPSPVEITVILSTRESGSEIARTISGSPVSNLSSTAASV